MLRRIVWGLAFVVALILNPGAGCGSNNDPPQWTYSESDMERAVVGTYVGAAGADASLDTVTLTIARAPAAPGSKPASLRLQCGSRIFVVTPAGACASLSTMPLMADLT